MRPPGALLSSHQYSGMVHHVTNSQFTGGVFRGSKLAPPLNWANIGLPTKPQGVNNVRRGLPEYFKYRYSTRTHQEMR